MLPSITGSILILTRRLEGRVVSCAVMVTITGLRLHLPRLTGMESILDYARDHQLKWLNRYRARSSETRRHTVTQSPSCGLLLNTHHKTACLTFLPTASPSWRTPRGGVGLLLRPLRSLPWMSRPGSDSQSWIRCLYSCSEGCLFSQGLVPLGDLV